MKEIEVKIVGAPVFIPNYVTPNAAGCDVKADINTAVTLKPLERAAIPTGIRIQLPEGYECQVRPKSGMAIKKGISIVNAPGTIDSDYRGTIQVILINLSNEPVTITPGMAIGQLVFKEYVRAKFLPTDALDDSERGEAGLGKLDELKGND